ncbi:unnamed protein product [Caenorhabditis sp. 36 PRJEB53466]|nr:unnamed protein product [Caenorhabditis sp. 36 PRJEB53466]
MYNFILIALISSTRAAPVSGPNFNDIHYAHNFTLTYVNDTLEGLGIIDTYADVDQQMASNLKDAINHALPEYLGSQSSVSTPVQSTTVASSAASGSSTSVPSRIKREASTANSRMNESSSSMPSSETTTQPYGTDEEFYGRTDLIHFHVDILDQEGSGTGENNS